MKRPDAYEAKARRVWAMLAADPEFVAGMERARQQHQAGEFRPYRSRLAPRGTPGHHPHHPGPQP